MQIVKGNSATVMIQMCYTSRAIDRKPYLVPLSIGDSLIAGLGSMIDPGVSITRVPGPCTVG